MKNLITWLKFTTEILKFYKENQLKLKNIYSEEVNILKYLFNLCRSFKIFHSKSETRTKKGGNRLLKEKTIGEFKNEEEYNNTLKNINEKFKELFNKTALEATDIDDSLREELEDCLYRWIEKF